MRKQLTAICNFRKTLHIRCLTGFWMCLCDPPVEAFSEKIGKPFIWFRMLLCLPGPHLEFAWFLHNVASVNPFYVTGLFRYPLKTSENLMIMMMMMMIMNSFCGMVDRRKAFSLISSQDHCQRSSPSQISDAADRIWTCKEPEFRFCWIITQQW